MQLVQELALVACHTEPDTKFEDLRRNIDPAWIEEALHSTGTATIRHRRLPASQVVWLVIGMALFRNRAITEVVNKLGLAMPGGDGRRVVANSAVAQARARLGDEPLAWLFSRCADEWAHASADAHRWRGLALYGVDGSKLCVPDSSENAAHFGYSKSGRGESGYPLVRVVGLMALRSHLLALAACGPYSTGEVTYAIDLWPAVPKNSLTIVDRGFFSASVLIALHRDSENRHWMTRGKKNISYRVLKRLGPGDYLIEMKVSAQAQKADPTLPTVWVARLINYCKKGFRPQTLVTSLIDPVLYPREELVTLYHERWELELGYDEIKTEMLEREEAIRSKSPTAVYQELWGIFLAYNLIRFEMERVAQQANVEPTRISFIAAMHLIVDEFLWCAVAEPGAIPRHLQDLRRELTKFILPPRRSQRSYPRVVKIKMSKFKKKHRRSPTRKR